MRRVKRPINVTNFGQLADGDLFVFTTDLARHNFSAVVCRKMIPYKGFNAVIEFFEGESCNRGMITVDSFAEVVPLM